MDNVEAMRQEHAPCEQRLPENSRGIFEQVAKGAAGIEWQRMTVDTYPLERLETSGGAQALRANYRHFITRVPQCRSFVPDPAIVRNREIFDDDQNTSGGLTN